jgi:hypothetical protein
MARPEVLIAEEPADPHSALAQRLARWGARCSFATSRGEICRLLGERPFDIVVCAATLADGSALRVVPLLAGSQTTLFCSIPVEDSCLWIRVVEKGHVCGRPFVWHPSEFGRVLHQALLDDRGDFAPMEYGLKTDGAGRSFRPIKILANSESKQLARLRSRRIEEHRETK